MNIQQLKKLFFLILLLPTVLVYGAEKDEIQIDNFIVEETLTKNNKLAILACDSSGIVQEHVNGTFQFTINGFKSPLKFNDGVAITTNEIESSTFVYLQHTNTSGTQSNLYYVLKKMEGLKIYKISWFLLLLVPIALIIFVMLFKRLLWLAIILLGIYLYYNSQKGLNLGSFLEIVLEGVKSLF